MSMCFTDIGPIPSGVSVGEGGGLIPGLGTIGWKDGNVIRQFDLDLIELSAFPTFGTAIFRLTFDDDGNAYRAGLIGGNQWRIFKRALTDTGAGTTLATLSTVSTMGMRWNPYDGLLYVLVDASSGSDRLASVDTTTGAETTLANPAVVGAAFPSFSPDGGVWFRNSSSLYDINRYDIPGASLALATTPNARGLEIVAMPDNNAWYHHGTAAGGGRSIDPTLSAILDEDCADPFINIVNSWSVIPWSKVLVTTDLASDRVLLWEAPSGGWRVGSIPIA